MTKTIPIGCRACILDTPRKYFLEKMDNNDTPYFRNKRSKLRYSTNFIFLSFHLSRYHRAKPRKTGETLQLSGEDDRPTMSGSRHWFLCNYFSLLFYTAHQFLCDYLLGNYYKTMTSKDIRCLFFLPKQLKTP